MTRNLPRLLTQKSCRTVRSTWTIVPQCLIKSAPLWFLIMIWLLIMAEETQHLWYRRHWLGSLYQRWGCFDCIYKIMCTVYSCRRSCGSLNRQLLCCFAGIEQSCPLSNLLGQQWTVRCIQVLKPFITPARSPSGFAWLHLNLPDIEVISIYMPIMFFVSNSTYCTGASVTFHGWVSGVLPYPITDTSMRSDKSFSCFVRNAPNSADFVSK